jgi:hypothetical protein
MGSASDSLPLMGVQCAAVKEAHALFLVALLLAICFSCEAKLALLGGPLNQSPGGKT